MFLMLTYSSLIFKFTSWVFRERGRDGQRANRHVETHRVGQSEKVRRRHIQKKRGREGKVERREGDRRQRKQHRDRGA